MTTKRYVRRAETVEAEPVTKAMLDKAAAIKERNAKAEKVTEEMRKEEAAAHKLKYAKVGDMLVTPHRAIGAPCVLPAETFKALYEEEKPAGQDPRS